MEGILGLCDSIALIWLSIVPKVLKTDQVIILLLVFFPRISLMGPDSCSWLILPTNLEPIMLFFS